MPEIHQVKDIWRLLATGDDSVLEIRALWPKGMSPSRPPVTQHFRVKDFESTEACKRGFESAAIELNELGPIFECDGGPADWDAEQREWVEYSLDPDTLELARPKADRFIAEVNRCLKGDCECAKVRKNHE
jgi:hypothetical protein